MYNNKQAYWTARRKAAPFNTKAHQKWGREAQWIHGEGPFASLSFCPSAGLPQCLTIQLFRNLEDAVRAQFNLQCGGGGQDIYKPNHTDWHQIWDMSNRGFKRLDKEELNKKLAAELPAEEPSLTGNFILDDGGAA